MLNELSQTELMSICGGASPTLPQDLAQARSECAANAEQAYRQYQQVAPTSLVPTPLDAQQAEAVHSALSRAISATTTCSLAAGVPVKP